MKIFHKTGAKRMLLDEMLAKFDKISSRIRLHVSKKMQKIKLSAEWGAKATKIKQMV